MTNSKIKDILLNKKNTILLKVYNNEDETVFLNETAQLLKNNIDILRLQNKSDNDKQFLAIAKKLKQICLMYDILLVIDSRSDIAVLCNADGIHLNENDLQIQEIKKIVNENLIVGYTIKKSNVEDIISADYICLSGIGTNDKLNFENIISEYKISQNKIFIEHHTNIDNTIYIKSNTKHN